MRVAKLGLRLEHFKYNYQTEKKMERNFGGKNEIAKKQESIYICDDFAVDRIRNSSNRSAGYSPHATMDNSDVFLHRCFTQPRGGWTRCVRRLLG
jgi:hypothetical protein